MFNYLNIYLYTHIYVCIVNTYTYIHTHTYANTKRTASSNKFYIFLDLKVLGINRT